jgi:translation initiation factor 1 (eIF-1/SUI1)
MKKTIVYINGIKASKKDLQRLESDLKAGTQTATARTTKNGNISIRTN